MELSILEFGEINIPAYPSENAIADVLELVVKAEELGYKRFWLAEHFTPDCAWAFPEMLLPLMAGYTSKIKIGVAGILLNYHNPFQVASNFKLLSFLFPDRIDLGIARGSIPLNVQKALKISVETQTIDIHTQMEELFQFMFDQHKMKEDLASINIPPYSKPLPDIWQLCSSLGQGVDFSVRYASNLCVSLVHRSSDKKSAKEVISAYRQANIINRNGTSGECAVAINVLCIDNIAQRSIRQKELNSNSYIAPAIIGDAAEVNERLLALQHELGVDEFIIHIPSWEYEERLETMSQLGRLFL